jgi:hypothetical protein
MERLGSVQMRTLIIGALTLFLTPGLALSQTVRGRVVDSSTDFPVSGARVELIGALGIGAGAADAAEDGRFEVYTRSAGTFRLRVQRIGYPTSTSEEFHVGIGEVVEVTFRLDPQAITLAPLTVEGRGGPDLGRNQFERRCGLGRGVCLDPIHIALAEPSFPTDLFRGIPGLIVDFMIGGRVRPIGQSRCLRIFVDNETYHRDGYVPATLMTPGVISAGNPARTRMLTSLRSVIIDNWLDTWIPAELVRGVEIYLTPEDVPDEIMKGPRGWDLWPDSRENFLGRCGAVVVWTAGSW